ncbi:hypothetical protein Trydic_g2158 [Trypoxylus dichotomus]
MYSRIVCCTVRHVVVGLQTIDRMKIPVAIIALLAITWLPYVVPQRINLLSAVDRHNQTSRIIRQTNADQMVQNILQWLDTVHGQGSRKIRQNVLRTYLPPTESPRPFAPSQDSVPEMFPPLGPTYHDEPFEPQPQPQDQQYPNEFPPSPGEEPTANEVTAPEAPSSQPSQEIPSGSSETEAPNVETPVFPTDSSSLSESAEEKKKRPGSGYPPSGFKPRPPFPLPTTSERSLESTTDTEIFPPFEPLPTNQAGQPPIVPSESTEYPPVSETSEANQPPISPESTEYPSSNVPTSPVTSEETPEPPSLPTDVSTFPPIFIGTTKEPEETRQPETKAPSPPATSSPTEGEPETSPTLPEVNGVTSIPEEKTNEPETTPLFPEVNPSEPETSPQPTDISPEVSPSPEDLRHPPHIHAIDVECAKDMMTINVEFNRRFDGIIYSKGFYTNRECRYVDVNSGKTKYTFTVQLDSCGTQFVNAFDTQNQSYLENVLVLQNEAGIQEVWDTVRAVRCLWEGSLKKSLTVSLSVGMLTEEIITFKGDTAVARLDIQRGEGPFAPSANGLVPIGEKMTLVISVSGDPGFDIQVKSCKAKSATGDLEYALTDDDGCVLRPKLFGAFQKTRNTGNTGASIIAYAFFYAFKFPDLMDLMMECNVELCKTDCDVCPIPDQRIEPGKRRRRNVYNETLGEPVTVGKLLRVLLPEDLSDGEALIEVKREKELCVSVTNFTFASVLLISLLTCSILFSGYMFLKHRTISYKHQL